MVYAFSHKILIFILVEVIWFHIVKFPLGTTLVQRDTEIDLI